MTSPVHIIATITPKPEHFSDCQQALKDLRKHTLKEAGCLRFDIFINEQPDGNIYMVEHFTDQASFEAHFEFEYTKAVFAKYELWLAEAVEAKRLCSF